MENYTPKRIREIFNSISYGIGNHGSFLKNLAHTAISADADNFNILRPSLEEIIEKYDLNKKPYVENDDMSFDIRKHETKISILNFELKKHMKDGKIYLYPSCYDYNKAIKIARTDSKLDEVDYVDVFIYKGNKVATLKDGKIKRKKD